MRKGKRVLVTDGIGANGANIVKAFAAYGASTAFFYGHSHDKAIKLNKDSGALNIRCKISNLDSLWAAREVIRGYFDDEFDTLICNVSLNSIAGFDDMDSERWRREIASEIDGLFYTVRALRPFLNRKGGSIIIAASKGVEEGFQAAVLEAYIEGLTKALADSLKAHSIRVNSIIFKHDESKALQAAEAIRRLSSGGAVFITGQVIKIK